MKISILICSVSKRLSKFAKLAEHLTNQAKGKPVEILWLGDNKTMSVAQKRNKLLSMATGEYICYVDDDDRVSDDYIDELLKATETNPDCICFKTAYHHQVRNIKKTVAAARTNDIVYDGDKVRRFVNHLNPVKREYALQVGFDLDKGNFGEDSKYGRDLWNSRLLQSDVTIDKVLYYYDFNPLTSETHRFNPAYKPVDAPVNPGVVMDVVMVSDGTKDGMKQMTQDAINSIVAENINIVVLEKGKNIKYFGADTFLQEQPFNYNKCLNDGAQMGNAELICFTNNDVLFPNDFVEVVMDVFHQTGADVVSVTNRSEVYNPNNISGYCFVISRKAYEKLGKFKEEYPFWCADNVVVEQMREHELIEYKSLIQVKHFVSTTLKTLDPETKSEYTVGCVKDFNRDYKKNLFNWGSR